MSTVNYTITTYFPSGLDINQLRLEYNYDNVFSNALQGMKTKNGDLFMTFEDPVSSTLDTYLTGTLFPNHEIPDKPSTSSVSVFTSNLYLEKAITKEELYRGSLINTSGLTFQANGIEYVIDNGIYRINDKSITLSAADPTNPRIDLICANILSKLEIVQGTPASTPVEPDLSRNLVRLSSVTIPAGSTTPDITATVVYENNTESGGGEWDNSTNTGNIDPDSTDNILSGTRSIAFTNVTPGNTITFTSGSSVSTDNFDSITLGIYLSSFINTTVIITPLESDLKVGRNITITDIIYGFNIEKIGVYQQLSIPITDFSIENKIFDSFQIVVNGQNTAQSTFYLDKIRLQQGLVAIADNILTPQFQIGSAGPVGPQGPEGPLGGQLVSALQQGVNCAEIHVGPAGQAGFIDVHTIADALARARDPTYFSPGDPITIEILPGTYIETTQLIIPANVTVRGEKANNCVVTSTINDQPLFKLRAGAALNNLHITGMNGSGGAAIIFDSTLDDDSPTPVRLRALVGGILITNCETGVQVTPKTPTGIVSMLLVNETLFAASSFSPVQTVGKAIRVEGGGLIHVSDSGTQEFGPIQIPVAFDVTGTGSEAAAIGVVIRGCTVGAQVNNGGRMRISSSALTACTTGVTIDGNDTMGTFQGMDVAECTNSCFTVSGGAEMNITSTNINSSSTGSNVFSSVGTSGVGNNSTMVISAVNVRGTGMSKGIYVQKYSTAYISSVSIKDTTSVSTGVEVCGTDSEASFIGMDIVNPQVGVYAHSNARFSSSAANIIDCTANGYLVEDSTTSFTASGNNIRCNNSTNGISITNDAIATISATTITGTTTNAIHMSSGSSQATVTDLTVRNSTTGIMLQGGTLDMASVNIYDATTIMTASGSGTKGTISGGTFSGSTDGVTVSTGTEIAISAVKIDGITNNTFYTSGSGAKLTAANVSIEGSVKGIVVDNSGQVFLSGSRIDNCTTALEVGSTGTTSKLRATSIEIDNCTNDLDIKPTAADISIMWGIIDQDKLLNPNNVSFSVAASSSKPGDAAVYIGSELHVGTPDLPREAVFGGGDSYTINMKVLTETSGGTFVDVSETAASQTGSLFTAWPEAATNAAFYVGGPRKFEGIKLLSGSVIPGDTYNDDKIALEFWNGSAWQEITRMATLSTRPYTSTATAILSAADYGEQIRFGMRKPVLDTWVTTTIETFDLYWVRFRQKSAISGNIPNIEQIKLHIGRLEVNADGYTERFGGVVRDLPWDWGLNFTGNGSFDPGTADLYLTDNFDMGRIENSYSSSSIQRTGFNTTLPPGIDTSKGIRIVLDWFVTSSATGIVEWDYRYAISRPGDPISNNTNGVGSGDYYTEANITRTQEIISNSSYTILQTEAEYLDISQFNARPATGEPDRLWLIIQRDGTSGNTNDTLGTNARVINFRASYIEVFDGGHPDQF